jgi:hypothetical protein
LRSLAERFAAPLEDVQALAERDELRALFPKRLAGSTALALVTAGPANPWQEDVA